MDPLRAIVVTTTKLTLSPSIEALLERLVLSACYETESAMAAIYLNEKGVLVKAVQSHPHPCPGIINDDVLLDFLSQCRQASLIHRRENTFLEPLFVEPLSRSALAVPLFLNDSLYAILLVNSREPFFYGKREIDYLEGAGSVATSLIERITTLEKKEK